MRKLKPIDYNQLTPGIRKTVQDLRELGFDTVDSGDGITNVRAGMEGALDFPHIFIKVSKRNMCIDADLLWAMVSSIPGASVEVTYSPVDKKAILALYGVDDSNYFL